MGRRRYSSNPFAISALEEGGQHQPPAVLLPGKNRYLSYTRLSRPRDGLNGKENLTSIRIRSLDLSAHSKSIYLLSELKCYPITFPFAHLRCYKTYSSFTIQKTDRTIAGGSAKQRCGVTDRCLQAEGTPRVMTALYKSDVKLVSTSCDLNTSDPEL